MVLVMLLFVHQKTLREQSFYCAFNTPNDNQKKLAKRLPVMLAVLVIVPLCGPDLGGGGSFSITSHA